MHLQIAEGHVIGQVINTYLKCNVYVKYKMLNDTASKAQNPEMRQFHKIDKLIF